MNLRSSVPVRLSPRWGLARSVAAIATLTAFAGSAMAIVIPEVEPNDNKAQATPALMTSGDCVRGTVPIGNPDYYRVTTTIQPGGPAIYRHQLQLISNPPGLDVSIRGLNQVLGVIGAADVSVQTGSATTTPATTVAWYGVNKGESLYYAVRNSAIPGGNIFYQSCLTSTRIDCQPVGTAFEAGSIEFKAGSAAVNTDLWLYDANLDAIPGDGNDDNLGSGGPDSRLVRSLPAGTYYLAISLANLANDLASPADDAFRNGNVTDFSDITVASTVGGPGTGTVITINDGVNPPFTLDVGFPGGSIGDVRWFCFTVRDSKPPVSPSCTCCGGRPAFADILPVPAFGPGVVSAITQEGDTPAASVVELFDLTAPLAVGSISPPVYAHPSWSKANLGNVFGICLGRGGDIYAGGTPIYCTDDLGTLGGAVGGKIYKIDSATGIANLFATLPSSLVANGTCTTCPTTFQSPTVAPGVGQVAFDCGTNTLYATNFEDGRIYRINAAGTVLSTYKHSTNLITPGGAPDALDGPGFSALNQNSAQRGERVWAVQPFKGRLYYSVWREDSGRPSAAVGNEIWSIALDASGNFTGASQLEFVVSGVAAVTNPVADIAFRPGCDCMIIGERSMQNDTCSSAHQSRVLEFCFNGQSWTPGSRVYNVAVGGFGIATSSAGGVDYDWTPGTKTAVWASADAAQFSAGTFVYGMMGMPMAGSNTSLTDSLVDFDLNTTGIDKFMVGSLDISCPECVQPPANMNLWLPLDETSGPIASNPPMAGTKNGVYVGIPNPISVPTPVDRGHCFDQNWYIQVPSYPGINAGVGGFTIDLWARQNLPNANRVAILDKRQGYTAAGRGYVLYTNNGVPSLDLRDNTGHTLTATAAGGPMAIGAWEHLTVTWSRVGTAQPVVQFYRNGLPVITNTVGSVGPWTSLSNNWPLRVGSRYLSVDPQSAWTGCMDEIEIFTRALRGQEVAGIAWRNKCKHSTHLPWDKPFCNNGTSITVPVQVCNKSGSSVTYSYIFGPVPGCGNTPSPSSYTPPSGNITVAAGFCGTINVTMPRPPFVNTGDVSCYQLCVTPQGVPNPDTICSAGSLQLSSILCPIIVNPTDWVSLSTNVATNIRVNLQNTSGAPSQGVLRLRVIGPDMEPDLDWISLNGLPPGEPILRTFDIPAGGTFPLDFDATFLGQDPISFYTVILEADFGGGQGDFEILTSIDLRNVPPTNECPADFNLSGTLSVQDIFDFLAAYFSNDPAADFNQSGTLSVQDIFDFLAAYFTGCP